MNKPSAELHHPVYHDLNNGRKYLIHANSPSRALNSTRHPCNSSHPHAQLRHRLPVTRPHSRIRNRSPARSTQLTTEDLSIKPIRWQGLEYIDTLRLRTLRPPSHSAKNL